MNLGVAYLADPRLLYRDRWVVGSRKLSHDANLGYRYLGGRYLKRSSESLDRPLCRSGGDRGPAGSGYVSNDVGKVGPSFGGKDRCGGEGGDVRRGGGRVGGQFRFSTLKTPFCKFKVSLDHHVAASVCPLFGMFTLDTLVRTWVRSFDFAVYFCVYVFSRGYCQFRLLPERWRSRGLGPWSLNHPSRSSREFRHHRFKFSLLLGLD